VSTVKPSDRAALGRIRESLHGRIMDYRAKRREAERTLENLARLEASALEEARAIDAMLELTNPYRR
jgi:hypothetical protein